MDGSNGWNGVRGPDEDGCWSCRDTVRHERGKSLEAEHVAT